MYFTLPFPSPLAPFIDCLPATNTVWEFRYMGRSKFKDILKEVEDPDFLHGLYSLYLNGPSGMGKSYILAALVCFLIRKGKRVVYIPDWGVLLGNPGGCLQIALQHTFHDDRGLCSQINSSRGMDHLLRIVNEHARASLYVVVDQLNALDPNDDYYPYPHTKYIADAQRYISRLGSSQRCIFSTSGKHPSDRASDGQQGNIKCIFLHAGLSEVRPLLFK